MSGQREEKMAGFVLSDNLRTSVAKDKSKRSEREPNKAGEETSLWGRRHSNHNSTEMVMAGGQGGKDRHKEQKHDRGKG